jgi:hypothetical protein
MNKLIIFLSTAMLAMGAAGSAWATSTGGTVEGTTTTLGNLPLNGVCGVLYDSHGTTELIDFAGTGTDGTAGHYIQENVPAGTYLLFFMNCGANTDGKGPDYYYTPIFYGSTWDVRQAVKVVVTDGFTTTLSPQAIPYGGYVVGTITDRTTRAPADSPPVAFVPPGGKKFFLSFSWMIVCGNPDGTYNSNTGFQQGVPPGSKVVAAPAGWGCTDSQGHFNAYKWLPKARSPVIAEGGTVTQNIPISEAAK